MNRYKFSEIAINCTKKKIPSEDEYSTYIGLEHLDTKRLKVDRWGSNVPIKGEKLIIKKGDVLLGKRNAYLRRAAIAPHNGIFSAHGMVLQPKENVVFNEFFPIFIGSDYFFDEAIKISVGSLSPTINWSDLKDIEFNLPSLEKQRICSSQLWSIINTIESYRELLLRSDEILKAKFIDLVGDIRDKNSLKFKAISLREAFEKPKAGEWGTEDLNGNGTPVLRTTNFTDNGTIDFSEVVTRKIDKEKVISKSLKNGDILMEKSGGSTDKPVGRVVYFDGKDGIYLNNNFTAVLRIKDNRLNPIFVFYYLFFNYWMGGTKEFENKTTGIHNINLNDFLDETFITIPDKEIQEEFVQIAIKISEAKKDYEKSIYQLQSIYERILARLFMED